MDQDMKKTLFTVLFVVFCVLSVAALAQDSQRYVRKKVQPNFFIPNNALAENKPEKVYIPRYGAGQTTAKRISSDDNLPDRQPILTKRQSVDVKETDVSVKPEIATTEYTAPSIPDPSQVNDETPSYQKMYQDYLRDLDSIAKTGEISDPAVLTDLEAMNSEKRIEIDKKFNQHRDVQKEIQSAIKK